MRPKEVVTTLKVTLKVVKTWEREHKRNKASQISKVFGYLVLYPPQ